MALQVSKLSKRSGNTWVLRDIDISVDDGEIHGIFAPEGYGKRVLLDVIAGHDEPSTGSIESGTKSPLLLENNEKPGIFQRLFAASVATNDGAFNVERARAEIRSKAPGTVLLDEPFRGLGTAGRAEIGNFLRETAAAGTAVIFTSSDFLDMLEFADRVTVLSKGYVGQTGTPQEIYDEPASVEIAAVVGRNNLFLARRLTSTKSETPEFITLEGEHRLFARRSEKAALGAINQNVTLMIRPEQISISFGASFPEDNLLKATVTAVKPMGATTRVELNCDGLKLEAMVLRLVGLQTGDECMVGLPPDRIAVLRQ